MNREQRRKAMKGYRKMLKDIRSKGFIPMPRLTAHPEIQIGDKVTIEYLGKVFMITPTFDEWAAGLPEMRRAG